MQSNKTHKAYRFYTTVDGSPTLEFSYDSGQSEAMHNSQGAFEESIYIYGRALDEAFRALPVPEVLSVGLGLGYNEFLTAAYSLKAEKPISEFKLTSFEHESFLTDNLLLFLKGELEVGDFSKAYSWILNAFAERFEIPEFVLKERLLEMKATNQWELESSFNPTELPHGKSWNVFLYDAFSSKLTPNLWAEESLVHLLSQHAQTRCFFSTYAATGSLKRALKTTGFVVEDRAGFSGKRQSTYAAR